MCGAALALYPFVLAPGHGNIAFLTGAALVSLAVGLWLRSHVLVACAAALFVAAYALALLIGDQVFDAYAAAVGVALLLMLELADLALARRVGTVEHAVVRRRAVTAAAMAALGCVVALVAQVVGAVAGSAGPWLLIVSAACGLGAISLTASLALRTLAARTDERLP